MRRRASPRPRSETVSPCDKNDDRKSRALRRAARRSAAGPCSRVPAAEQRRLDFAAVRALEAARSPSLRQRRRPRSSRRARRSPRPAGARRHWHRAARAIVCGSSRMLALADSLYGAGVKAALRRRGFGAWAAAGLVMDVRSDRRRRREYSWPKRSRCWPVRRRRTSPCTSAIMRASPAVQMGRDRLPGHRLHRPPDPEVGRLRP